MATRTAVRVWLSEQGRLALDKADPADLRKLVNITYVGLCEYVGPVAADAALERAVRAVNAEEPALTPTLRQLL